MDVHVPVLSFVFCRSYGATRISWLDIIWDTERAKLLHPPRCPLIIT